MKTLYYYFRWLWKQFKFDYIYLLIISAISFAAGIIMNVMGIMIHTKINENGRLEVWRDEYWPAIGDKFLIVGIILFISTLVIKTIKDSFNRFKQEQRDLLKTINNGK